MSLHSCPNSQCTTPRVNPNVNYGLWMIMMCQCVFIYCNKYTALMEDVVNGGSCACMVSESIWEISVSFAQLMLLMEEAVHAWCQRLYGKSLYHLLNFSVHLI